MEMDENKETEKNKVNVVGSMNCTGSISTTRSKKQHTVWDCVIPYVEEPDDRAEVSRVCKQWHKIDGLTRKGITISPCYAATPDQLFRRFPNLESLKIKGQPRAAMYNLIPPDWGGYARPWVEEIVRSFKKMKALHFRRMIVTDSDLELLATSAIGKRLEVLKLDKCSGFSTDGLLHITRFCRSLRTLYLEDSTINEKDGEWLHELALKNKILENINFYTTDLAQVSYADLELIARNCESLVSLKITDSEVLGLIGFFRNAAALEEFGGGNFGNPHEDASEQLQRYSGLTFPQRLCSLALSFLGTDEMPIVFPVASQLKKLDLLYAMLDTQGHCHLLQRCPNLETLVARSVIGDRGLEVVAKVCKKLKRLKIDPGAEEREDAEGEVTHRGLIALSQGCRELGSLALHVSDITNASLAWVGTYLKKLYNFRLILMEERRQIADFPLDNGVRSLLVGCHELRRFALYLRPGGLTDVGLRYIGQYSPKIRYMLLGFVGESDNGLIEFSKGCPSLQKLEMRGCRFSEVAIAAAVTRLTSLRYLWAQGYIAAPSTCCWQVVQMLRPNWITEVIPATEVLIPTADGQLELVHKAVQVIAYYSLAQERADFPPTVRPVILPKPPTRE